MNLPKLLRQRRSFSFSKPHQLTSLGLSWVAARIDTNDNNVPGVYFAVTHSADNGQIIVVVCTPRIYSGNDVVNMQGTRLGQIADFTSGLYEFDLFRLPTLH